MFKALSLTASVLFALSQSAYAAPVRVLDTNFPDPCLIKTGDEYYAFATTGNGVNAQVAHSNDFFSSWERLAGTDALPGPFPDWVADPPNIWAPDVIQLVSIQPSKLKASLG